MAKLFLKMSDMNRTRVKGICSARAAYIICPSARAMYIVRPATKAAAVKATRTLGAKKKAW